MSKIKKRIEVAKPKNPKELMEIAGVGVIRAKRLTNMPEKHLKRIYRDLKEKQKYKNIQEKRENNETNDDDTFDGILAYPNPQNVKKFPDFVYE